MRTMFTIYAICFALLAALLYAMHQAAPNDLLLNIFIGAVSVAVLGAAFLAGLVMLLERLERRGAKNG